MRIKIAPFTVRDIQWQDRTSSNAGFDRVFTSGAVNSQGHRTYHRVNGEPDLYLFDDEIRLVRVPAI